MRKILFRGKRVANGEWVEGGFVHQTDFYGMEIDEYLIIDGTETEDNNIGFSYEVIPETVGQYIGLDKNGTKVFEGDIVRFDGYPDFYAYICYENFEFICKSTKYKFYACRLYPEIKLEVVGNIYDNPELLKGDVENE